LEDIEGLSISVIDSLIHTPNPPGFSFPTDLTYDEPNYPAKIPKNIGYPPPGNQFYVDYGGAGYNNVYDSIRYDPNTGKYYLMDGSFRIEHIMNILGVESATGSNPQVPALPSDLLLPSNIEIEPVLRTDQTGQAYYDFTIILHKEVFPHYQKRIIIIDKTPTMTNLLNKIYEIRVIVYWTLKDGTMKSITVTGEKSATRQQD
jgi:hypothetical protein